MSDKTKNGSKSENQNAESSSHLFDKKIGRRKALGLMAAGTASSVAVVNSSCGGKGGELAALKWDEFFKGNYRVMSVEERNATVERQIRIHELKTGKKIEMSSKGAEENVLFGYAFNISKCRGYMECVKACVMENNLDRKSNRQYIRIFEQKKGVSTFEHADSQFSHEVPAEGKYYFGAQCFHCSDPACVKVCPVGATWKDDDGIVVIDYDWCIGCRYCAAACPYWSRRFNWGKSEIPEEEYNKKQHYLGNRSKKTGVMEKCTFCIQRTREGLQPACVEACPTGARVFGNLLDPESEIRYILANKSVYRLKEELGTEPSFWFYTE